MARWVDPVNVNVVSLRPRQGFGLTQRIGCVGYEYCSKISNAMGDKCRPRAQVFEKRRGG